MGAAGHIRAGHSIASEAKEAVAEFHNQVMQADMALVLFFCSTSYDLDTLAEEMNRCFPGVTVVGCTTAGEIGPAGYQDRSLSGMSFSASAFVAEVGYVDDLQSFEIASGRDFAEQLFRRLELRTHEAKFRNSFGFLLIDGLSLREEQVTHALQDGLGAVPMIGGSAGDDLKFDRTWIFHDGGFHTDSAALVLMSTRLPFHIIRTQHFVADSERLVVTEVDAAKRVVHEINGLPAVEEYARLVGVAPEQLTPSHFATWPVVVMIDGTDFVRSIQHANPDGSLTFYCAIDEGVVLRVAHGERLLEKLEATFTDLERELGSLEGMLVCDCILRNLEIARNNQKAAVGDVFRRHNAVGFSTYGEQFGGVHINQTLTGIAIGSGTTGHG
ncbi:MAG: FIST C-terminal domain-containing protein [Betaproteobacteria bacterium]|nr:FIST C-terminal domain-containing protein [Betaproteobacteria bacterium]